MVSAKGWAQLQRVAAGLQGPVAAGLQGDRVGAGLQGVGAGLQGVGAGLQGVGAGLQGVGAGLQGAAPRVASPRHYFYP